MKHIIAEIIVEEDEEAKKIMDELDYYILQTYNVEQVVFVLKNESKDPATKEKIKIVDDYLEQKK